MVCFLFGNNLVVNRNLSNKNKKIEREIDRKNTEQGKIMTALNAGSDSCVSLFLVVIHVIIL